jgi:hypothetical protein
MTSTKTETASSTGRRVKEAATSRRLHRRGAAAAFVTAAAAACAVALTHVTANATPPEYVKSVHVASLTIVRDRATGTISGFPNRRKVTINNAAYVADQSGNIHLTSAPLNRLRRLALHFAAANGYVETGSTPLKHATTGKSLTSAQLDGTKPNRTKPQTMKLSIRPALYSPPPTRPKTKA